MNKSPSTHNIDAENKDIEGFSYINQIDRSLKIVASLHTKKEDRIELKAAIFYQNEFVASLSFVLHDHTDEEAIDIAKNIKSNDYIIYKIEEYLAGDIVE